TREMVMPLRLRHLRCSPNSTPVQAHQVAVRRGERKDHATAAPVAGCMRPGAQRRIAHTILLCQGHGNASLLQVRLAAAHRQGGLEGGELLREVRLPWSGLRRYWWTCGERLGCCHWLLGKRRCRRATVWDALPAGWRPPEGCLALLFRAPALTRLFQIAPG